MEDEASINIHPEGEEQIAFETAGGKVTLQATREALTAYGGLLPFAAFLKQLGLIETLEKTCPVVRTSPNAKRVADILQSFMLTALADGRRFAHVERMREDPALCALFGLKSVVGPDTIRRLFASIDPEAARTWLAQASAWIWQALPEPIILDWDSTVQTKYGHQEGAAIGYNPTKPGRKSFHPLVAVAAGTRLCMAYRFRSGDTVTATQWQETMEDAQRRLGKKRIWLNRGDIGLGHEAIMRWHEEQTDGPHYLFKLKQTKNVRSAISLIAENEWEGPAQSGVWQTAETRLKLSGWSSERRVVIMRKAQGAAPASEQTELWKFNRHEYAAYVTDLEKEEVSGWQVHSMYCDRADAENVFDELKNQWGFNGFCSGKKSVSALAAGLLLLVYNLWSLLMRIMEPRKHLEAVSSRRWLLLIPARLCESGRQKTLNLAVRGRWWELIKEGSKRIWHWLRSTAAQLKIPPPDPMSTNLLLPSKTAINCGF